MHDAATRGTRVRPSHRALIVTAVAFIAAGALHFAVPRAYVAIMPPYLPNPLALVLLSGVFEILGGAGLLVPPLRKLAGVGLIALLVAVVPANVEMLRQAQARDAGLLVQTACWLRLPLQPLLMWWVWRVAVSRNDLSR
jgi:uncharacterized membrane protein